MTVKIETCASRAAVRRNRHAEFDCELSCLRRLFFFLKKKIVLTLSISSTKLTFDYQFVDNPIYRGPVNVFAGRVHWQF